MFKYIIQSKILFIFAYVIASMYILHFAVEYDSFVPVMQKPVDPLWYIPVILGTLVATGLLAAVMRDVVLSIIMTSDLIPYKTGTFIGCLLGGLVTFLLVLLLLASLMIGESFPELIISELMSDHGNLMTFFGIFAVGIFLFIIIVVMGSIIGATFGHWIEAGTKLIMRPFGK